MKPFALASAILLCAGCTSDPDDGDDDDTCIQHQGICRTEAVQACYDRAPTIATGLYGCMMTVTDDTTPAWASPLPGRDVPVFDEDLGAPIVVGATDTDGFYQVAPPPGTYRLCNAAGASDCSQPFTVEAGAPRAVDIQASALVLWVER